MIPHGIRHGAFATTLTAIALATAACGGHAAASVASSASYPALDGAQLKSALLADSDMPAGAGLTADDSQSGNHSPTVTSPTPSPAGSGVSGAAASDPACAALAGALAQSASDKGGDGSNAYADTGFQTADDGTTVSETLEAYPAEDLSALRSRLSLVRGSMARCSTLTTMTSTVSATAVSAPTLGDGSAWFSFTDTLENHIIKLATTTIVVGNVGITLSIGSGGPGSVNPVPVLETIAQKAVARVTSLQKQVG